MLGLEGFALFAYTPGQGDFPGMVVAAVIAVWLYLVITKL